MMRLDMSKRSHRILGGILCVFIWFLIRGIYDRSQSNKIYNKSQSNKHRKKTNVVQEETDLVFSKESKRVSIDETNFVEIFASYVSENEEEFIALEKIEEGRETKEEKDFYKKILLSLFDNNKIRLNSTKMFYSGIMYMAENGQVIYEFTLKNGKLNGLSKKYYESGEISSEKLWENGEMISSKCWDINGNLEEC